MSSIPSPPSYDEAASSSAASAPDEPEGIPANQESSLARFQNSIERYEISAYFAAKLRQLENFKIVVICDDSSSMASTLAVSSADPFGPTRTRWDELKSTVNIIIDFAGALDRDGCDVCFLNRPGVQRVTHVSQVEQSFRAPPHGYTPIVPVLRRVLQDTKPLLAEKKLLIVIATDGSPTDPDGNNDTRTLRQVLERERVPIDRIYTTFLACTDDDSTIEYLADWDEKIPHVDVVDDYHSERKEVWRVQGNQFPFSFGDYVTKALLGAIDPELDQLDEVKLGTLKKRVDKPSSGCIIL